MINLRALADMMPEAEYIGTTDIIGDDFVSLPAFRTIVTKDGEVMYCTYTASGNGNNEILLLTIGDHIHDNLKFIRWVILRVAVLYEDSLKRLTM